jgi:predicted nucleotidyltransferase
VAIADQVQQLLEGMPEVRFALLFGSHARGAAGPCSDLDVAVYAGPALSPKERFTVRLEVASRLQGLGETDVVILNDAPAFLGHRALQGQLVLVRDRAEYVRYFVRTLAASGDQAHYRAIHAAARERRLLEGRFGRP